VLFRSLIGVRHRGTVVYVATDAIAILIVVCVSGAGIAGVAERVAVAVCLRGVGL
jgi:hypothetical protein